MSKLNHCAQDALLKGAHTQAGDSWLTQAGLFLWLAQAGDSWLTQAGLFLWPTQPSK